MYNANVPKDIELPSSKKLIKSTVIALVAALILLFTVILPAEYGFDPTGVGQTLGLTKMGEIKKQLASEAEEDIQPSAAELSQPVAKEDVVPAKAIEDDLAVETIPVEATPSETKSTQLKPVEVVEASRPVAKEVVLPKAIEDDLVVEIIPAEVKPSETRSVQLQPGEAAEIKLGMKKGAVVTYEWSVDTGHLNYDTHGDGVGIKYFGYNKGKALTGDKGELQAAFDGKHGWFWRNRSSQTVTVTLRVSGDYSGVHRVL